MQKFHTLCACLLLLTGIALAAKPEPKTVAAAILEEKSPVDTGGENGPDSVTSKADIIKYLKDSFAYLHKATLSINDKSLVAPVKNPFGEGTATRLALAPGAVGHCFDHYGQMVEYLRLNGIIPPASR